MQAGDSQCPSESTDLACLWRLLVGGTVFITEIEYSFGRCYGVLEARSGRRPARPNGLAILERVFEGESQKTLAYELGLAVATIAGHTTAALGRLVHERHVSRAPILVIMAALAGRGLSLEPARLESLRDDGRWVLSVQVPGESFRPRLSPSEWEVARLLIEGETHAEIARLRGTSARTIANQLASVFDKLAVFGRGELRAKAVREAAARATTHDQLSAA